MSDKIYDDLKKIHDTPRADKAFICAETSGNLNWDIYQEARLLEKEMNQYKTHIEFQYKRIKLLESANSDVERIANERNAAYQHIEELKRAGNELAAWVESIYQMTHLLSLEQYKQIKRDLREWEKVNQ